PGTVAGTTPAASVGEDQIPLIVYRPSGTELEAQRVSVPRTQAVARAALKALGISVDSLSIAEGTATLDLPEQPTGLALAQLVFPPTVCPPAEQLGSRGR